MIGKYYLPSDEFFLEEYSTDKNRVRVVPNKGTSGKWFSRLRHTNQHGYLDVPRFALPDCYFQEENDE